MKKSFPGYYPLNNYDYELLFKNATIVFDINVLLDLFRIEKTYINQICSVMEHEKVKGRLWMPFDIAWFYHNSMNDIILEQISNIGSTLAHLNQCKSAIDAFKQYPFLAEDKRQELNFLITNIKEICDNEQNDLANQLRESQLKETISRLYEGKVGPEYNSSEMDKIYAEANQRYPLSIPPGYINDGYMDKRKKYHGLIVWKQLIRYAKESNNDILYVTGKVSEDWYYIERNKIISPRHELQDEFRKQTKKHFFAMNFSEFIKKCCEIFNIRMDREDFILRNISEPIVYASVNNKNTLDNQI